MATDQARIDQTHDPKVRSWVESANDPETDYPIQNLPLCSFRPRADPSRPPGVGALIGRHVFDLGAAGERGLLGTLAAPPAGSGPPARGPAGPLARIMSLSARERRTLRATLWELLRSDTPELRENAALRAGLLPRLDDVELVGHSGLPGNYTDFYASKHHATNVGSMFRPDNPLLPNYRHVPIGYHGRASSIVVSGTPVRRPLGQTKGDDPPGAPPTPPAFGPCRMLDYEMELGVFIGAGNRLGDPIDIRNVREHVFGMCIVNDWSARDIQKWEYQPLGPFLAKNFATTISPCVVTMEALEPFRVPGPHRDPGDPEPLDYLSATEPWGMDITVEVHLASEEMRRRGLPPVRLSRGSFKDMYWTIAQMVAHHASNGCNLEPGDLLASGTISGPGREARGCLLELTWDGHDAAAGKPRPRVPIALPTGESRLFLQDGDEVIMRASCERDGFRRIGFGECRGVIMPAPAL
ncbi:MAG TPA: fumarylacetoacetase [Phycisphaerales bacterium]|nr:fumarylacetoacetase [Phycisphaerales bacterium]